MAANFSFTTQEFEEFRRYLKDRCGITLGDNKQYLVASRLGRLMQDMAVGSLGELVNRLQRDARSDLHARVIDAMTTNETYWFRDVHPFEILKKYLLPAMAAARPDRLRIWSTACSSGQEPYSISMAVQEFKESQPGKLPEAVEILATDISGPVLTAAREGLYDEITLARGLTVQRRQKFFDDKGAAGWQVKDIIRQRVRFMEMNLLHGYDLLGKFDLIYCRNVLIYFSNDMKREILAKMAKTMRPGAFLVMGVSESPVNYSDAFEIVRFDEGLVYRLIPRN